jgi:hypothetical protein
VVGIVSPGNKHRDEGTRSRCAPAPAPSSRSWAS